MSDDANDKPLDDILGKGFLERPHDGLVRHAFSDLDLVRAELRAALPAAIVERLDLSVLQPEPRSFVSDELKDFH